MGMIVSQPAEATFWSTFKGAGYLTMGGIAMMGEAASLVSLKLINSMNTEETVLRQLQNITCIAIGAIALGAALVVHVSSCAIASQLFTGAASLLFSAEITGVLSFIEQLAFSVYSVYLHINGFQWALTPYSIDSENVSK